MTSFLKASAIALCAKLGLPRLLHRTLFKNEVAILEYHAVIPSPLALPQSSYLDQAMFRRQVRYLKRHFNVMPLTEAIQQLKENRVRRPTAVITFDDGFQNNYDVAFPILREEGLPATIFLTTGVIDTADTPWFCRLQDAMTKSPKESLEWDGRLFDLSGPDARVKALADIKKKLKQLPSSKLIGENRRIVRQLGDDPDRPIAEDSPFRMLSRAAIKEMSESGLIDFGAHTHSHAIVSRLNANEQRREIEQSVNVVRELAGRPCEAFAYPNGGPDDYTSESIRILCSFGLRAAVTGIAGPNTAKTPPLELRRYGVVASDDMAHFEIVMHHLPAHLRGLLRGNGRISGRRLARPVGVRGAKE